METNWRDLNRMTCKGKKNSYSMKYGLKKQEWEIESSVKNGCNYHRVPLGQFSSTVTHPLLSKAGEAMADPLWPS